MPLDTLIAHAFDKDILPDDAWIVGNGLLFPAFPVADTWYLHGNFS